MERTLDDVLQRSSKEVQLKELTFSDSAKIYIYIILKNHLRYKFLSVALKKKKKKKTCLIYRLLFSSSFFYQNITSQYEVKTDWLKPSRPHLFSWTSLPLQSVIKSALHREKDNSDKNHCNHVAFFSVLAYMLYTKCSIRDAKDILVTSK